MAIMAGFNSVVSQIIEATFVLIMTYLILKDAGAFSTAAKAVGDVYVGAVKTLQGR